MHAILGSNNTSHNALAARFQDDAYTFAYYMIGDEARAEQVTEAAFAWIARRRQLRPASIRAEILRAALENCQQQRIPITSRVQPDDLAGRLQWLGQAERSAAVLVDVVGCSYEEAAGVLGCSTRQVARLLARARLALGNAALSG